MKNHAFSIFLYFFTATIFAEPPEKYWPKKITIFKDTNFKIQFGNTTGSIKVPLNTEVEVAIVNLPKLKVTHNKSYAVIDVGITNFLELAIKAENESNNSEAIKNDLPISYDSGGWNKVEWGMTKNDVKEQYPKAVKLGEIDNYTQNGQNFTSDLVMANFELANSLYYVAFLFDGEGKLGGVILTMLENATPTDFKTLNSLISDKYGPPSERETKPIRNYESYTNEYSRWNTEKCIIKLNLISFPQVYKQIIKIIYLNPSNPQLDKL